MFSIHLQTAWGNFLKEHKSHIWGNFEVFQSFFLWDVTFEASWEVTLTQTFRSYQRWLLSASASIEFDNNLVCVHSKSCKWNCASEVHYLPDPCQLLLWASDGAILVLLAQNYSSSLSLRWPPPILVLPFISSSLRLRWIQHWFLPLCLVCFVKGSWFLSLFQAQYLFQLISAKNILKCSPLVDAVTAGDGGGGVGPRWETENLLRPRQLVTHLPFYTRPLSQLILQSPFWETFPAAILGFSSWHWMLKSL